MDRWMQAYAVLTARQFPHADPTVPGTGAAGGLGFAFLSYMNAVLEPGASIVLEETSLEPFIRDSDIVITGEGRLDGQTAMGKAPIAVARLAKKYGKPSSPSPAASPQMPSSVTMPESTPFSQFSAPSVRWKKQWNRHPPGRI